MIQSIHQSVHKLRFKPNLAVIKVGTDIISQRYIHKKRESIIDSGMNVIQFDIDHNHIHQSLSDVI